MSVSIDKSGRANIHVQGIKAAEVESVARALTHDMIRRREDCQLRSPWFSGVFYLTALSVIIALLLVAGSVLALWVLPAVIVGAAILVAIVGALQMRQDGRLSPDPPSVIGI